jgi:hypothetical protein
MQISLVAVICANILNPESCVREFVTDSTQNEMSMQSCLGMEGMVSAANFVLKHPLYKTWKLQGAASIRSRKSRLLRNSRLRSLTRSRTSVRVCAWRPGISRWAS